MLSGKQNPRLPLTIASEKRRFRRRLLDWYDRNARDLPWRRDRDPYRVWVSEIMLQQTRVAAVIEHYRTFIARFPTVRALAKARESSILAAWSGLGYYRRARMLHRAAKSVLRDYAGEFPASADELRGLDGIGRYTAAAIASIAFGEAAAVVDGNVERVLERLFGHQLLREEPWELAEALLSRQRPGDFNQAMMELGATVCTPLRPKCEACPVFDFCLSHGELEKAAKGKRQKKRVIGYTLNRSNGAIFLVRRPKQASLMPGMWELPGASLENGGASPWLTLRHSITETDFIVQVRRSSSAQSTPQTIEGRWLRKEQIVRLPLTGLARKILRAAKVI
jgi:A/G-specific adenine glycosylase